MKKQEV